MAFPGAFGLLAKGAAWTLAAGLEAGIMGASLGSNIWLATHKQHENTPTANFDVLQNTISDQAMIPIIYGQRKWGGYQTWHSASSDKKTLTKDIVFCEGEIDSISDVRANNIPISSLSNCSYTFANGAVSQSPPSNYNTVGGYKNCAWIRAVLTASDQLQGGNPTITAIIKGLKIYDTRTGVTAYSTNPAMCVRDYLLARRYGLGRWITADMLDEDSFRECADYCDQSVAYYVPSTLSTADAVQSQIDSLTLRLAQNPGYSSSVVDSINDSINSLKESLISIQSQPVSQILEIAPRYTTNIILATEQSHIDNLQSLMATFGGFLVFTGDKISLRMEKAEDVAYTFDDNSICFNDGKPDIQWETSSLIDTPNQYNVTFYDPNNNYIGVPVVCNDRADQQDRQRIIPKDVTLDGVTDQSQALRLARIFMAKNRLNPLILTFKTATMAMHLQPGDVIAFTHRELVGMLFRIIQISESAGVYTLKCNQYNPSIYDDKLGSQITQKNYCTVPNAMSDTIPDVSNIATTQNFYVMANSNTMSTMNISWELPVYTFYRQVIIDYSIDGGNTFVTAGYTKDTSFTLVNALVGTSYYLRIRVENSVGRVSEGTVHGPVLVTGKDSPPSDITGLVVAQCSDYLRVSFDTPNDADYNHAELRFGGNSWSTATKLGVITNCPGNINADGILDGTVIFRAKAVDNGGNYSENDCEYTLEITGLDQYKNIVLTRDDATISGGQLTNLVRLPNNELISTSSIELGDYATFADLPIQHFVDPVKHIEYLSPVVDTEKIGKTGVKYAFKYNFHDEFPVFGSFPNRTFGDYPMDTFGNITIVADVLIQIRFSNDNIIWTPWQPYIAGDYTFRYIQFSVTADYESTSCRAIISSLAQAYDVPDVTFSQKFDVPVDGLTIVFNDCGADFYTIPTEIIPTVLNGFGNVYPDITNISATGLTLKCYDRTGAECAGTVLLVCKGY